MKLIIELTPQQLAKLQKENRYDLPLTSFIKSTFKFKSVERVVKKKGTHTIDTSIQDVLHRINKTR